MSSSFADDDDHFEDNDDQGVREVGNIQDGRQDDDDQGFDENAGEGEG
jgi:hypothetical protein